MSRTVSLFYIIHTCQQLSHAMCIRGRTHTPRRVNSAVCVESEKKNVDVKGTEERTKMWEMIRLFKRQPARLFARHFQKVLSKLIIVISVVCLPESLQSSRYRPA